jgi:hypothetical protein
VARAKYAEHKISEEAYRVGMEQVEGYKAKEVQFWQLEPPDYTRNP